MVRAFDWRDGERLIRFGRGVAADAVQALGGPGYLLLTTSRAGAVLPAAAEAAAGVHHVPPGGVPELAAAALAWARAAARDAPPVAIAAHSWATRSHHDTRIVALGGGRVVDVAKAVAAALGDGARAMAIPTTLSGAEMTRVHRHAAGVDEETPRVRCAVVVCDPALAASQPGDELAASALNALGHAVEAPCTVAANPVATLAAHEAARLLVGAFAGAAPDRDALALGALLAGYALDSTGYGLHHVLAQTLVRQGLAGHGQANAVLLPHTIAALARRFPEQHAALAAALGEDPAGAAARLCALTGATRLRELGVDARGARGVRGDGRGAAAARQHAAAAGARRAARDLRGRRCSVGAWKAASRRERGQRPAGAPASSRRSTPGRGRRCAGSRSSRASCAAASSPRDAAGIPPLDSDQVLDLQRTAGNRLTTGALGRWNDLLADEPDGQTVPQELLGQLFAAQARRPRAAQRRSAPRSTGSRRRSTCA